MRFRELFSAGLLPGLLACTSVVADVEDRPAYRLHTERGPAYAADREMAERLALDWDRTAARLEAVIPAVRPVPDIEIWMLPPGDIPDPFGVGQPMGGVTYLVGGHPTLIHVPDNEEFLWVLGHELTHAVVDVSPQWRTLPGVLEEGLCA